MKTTEKPAQANATSAQVPLSPSESRSLTRLDSGASTWQFDDLSSSDIQGSKRHNQIQSRELSDPQSSPQSSAITPNKRQRSSINPSDTTSLSPSVANKRPRLDLDEKSYPCLECGKSFAADRWYDHLVRVHFPEYVWACECKENQDPNLPKLWLRWDNFRKHMIDKHNHTRNPEADAALRSGSLKVEDCYHSFCGFCQRRLESRQSSLEHIKEHLDDGLQLKDWTHRCSSKHDLRSHIPGLKNKFGGVNNADGRATDDDESNGDGFYPPNARGNQNYGSDNGPRDNAGGPRSSRRNEGESKSHGNHQSDGSGIVHCEVAESLLPYGSNQIMIPFKSLRELGRGGYGVVDEVISNSSKETFARKTIRSRQTSHDKTSHIGQLRNELQILKTLKHPHLIKLVCYYTYQASFCIIMSPVADLNLADYMRQNYY